MLYVEIYKNHELNRLSNCGILEILRNFLEMIEKLSTNNIYKEICKIWRIGSKLRDTENR